MTSRSNANCNLGHAIEVCLSSAELASDPGPVTNGRLLTTKQPAKGVPAPCAGLVNERQLTAIDRSEADGPLPTNPGDSANAQLRT